MVTLPLWTKSYNEISTLTRNDNGLMAFPFPIWLKNCVANTLASSLDSCRDAGIFTGAIANGPQLRKSLSCMGRNISVQKHLYRLLRPTFDPFDEGHYIKHKLSRWFVGAQLDNIVCRIRFLAIYLPGKVPPCVLFALMRSWFNGWCTARRMQNPHSAVVFVLLVVGMILLSTILLVWRCI